MSDSKKSEVCLKCDETVQAVRKENLICGSVDSFGELSEEFGKHKWSAWSDKQLDQMGIFPEYYEGYRFVNWNSIVYTDNAHKKPVEVLV